MIIAHVKKIKSYKLGVYLGCDKSPCNDKEQYILNIIDSTNDEEKGMVILLCETHFQEFMTSGGAVPKEELN
jgi:hypothetical protein